MTLADVDAARADPAPSQSATANAAADLAVPRGCPFLQSQSGGWRLDLPTREHRCAAFAPASPLSPEKQARLCLTPAYSTCATYLASLAAREARLGVTPGPRATRWGLAHTTTVIEDPGGIRGRLLAALLDRRRWPAIPAVLLVTTLFALALSGFRADIPSTAVATSSPAPTPAGTPRLTEGPVATATEPAPPTQTVRPSAAPTAAPTEAPTATPAPARTPSPTSQTYVVQPGDTLSAIARQFGTTVQRLVNLNNIANPNQLTIGQVLTIP